MQKDEDHSRRNDIDKDISQRRIRRHILDHLLALFQLALPPRSDVQDIVSLDSISRIDAQSDRNPNDESLDLINANYMDPEYVSPLEYQARPILEVSGDEIPVSRVIPSTIETNFATDPVLEKCVRNAMMGKDMTESNYKGFLRALVDLIAMNLSILLDLHNNEEHLERNDQLSRLFKLRNILREMQYGLNRKIKRNPPISLGNKSLVCIHETLWACAYRLGFAGQKTILHQSPDTEDLEQMIDKLITHSDDIFRVNDELDLATEKDLAELQAKLMDDRPGISSAELNLTQPGRQMIHRGDVLGLNKAEIWQEMHAILLDHCLVLAGAVPQRSADGHQNGTKYDIAKLPIPMDLLVLESGNDELVRFGKGMVDQTLDRIWPFRITHLGVGTTYILGVETRDHRRKWTEKIIEAKSRHAASLYERKAEPFCIEVLAEKAFAYDPSYSVPSVNDHSRLIQGTPLHRAFLELEHEYEKGAKPQPPVCRVIVNCATTLGNGSSAILVGTNDGVYISDTSPAGNWDKVRLEVPYPRF